MNSPDSPPPFRLARWPFVVLIVASCVTLWCLAGRQPATWPDAAAPWFAQTQAWLLVPQALDRLTAWAPLTPDLSVGAVVILVLLGATTLATSLALGGPPSLALGTALSLMATRSAWSTVTPGHDALPLLLVAVGVLTVVRPRSHRLAIPGVLLGLGVAAPTAAWLVAPAVAAWPGSRRTRLVLVLVGVVIALTSSVLTLRHAWHAASCVDASMWTTRIADIARPNASATTTPWVALHQSLTVLVGDVHLFGIVVAGAGLTLGTGAAPAFRRAALIAAGGALAAVAVGVLPPAHAAALVLPWWVACFGLGLTALVRAVPPRRQSAALASAVIAAVGTPLLRHVVLLPQPWTTAMPTITRAVVPEWHGDVVAVTDEASARLMRVAGIGIVPVDTEAIRTCLAAGRRLHALGPTIGRLEDLGFRLDDRPLLVPMRAVLRDVRAGSLVALAVTPGALAWAGPQGLSALTRLGVVAAAMPVTTALGVVARADAGDGRADASRDGVEFRVEAGDEGGRRHVPSPVSVHASATEAGVDSGSRRLVRSAQAALTVFDRAGDVALRATADARPGLPVSLATLAPWRHAIVAGAPSCVAAGRGWTVVTSPAGRISVPMAGASPSRPLVAYLTSAERPSLELSGSGGQVSTRAMRTETFDRDAGDRSRLLARLAADGVEGGTPGAARFVVRLELRPTDVWQVQRLALSAGTPAASWLVHAPARGRSVDASAICRFAADGLRVLRGQGLVVDDETVRELTVWARDGWNPAEQLPGDVFQWTGRASATASFRADAMSGLVLALDAMGADTPEGPQPVTIRINGAVLHSSWGGAGRLEIPAALLRRGDNELSLDVRRIAQAPGDTRSLGVLVRALRVIVPR